MRITEGHIYLREARFHACHGVMPQERQVGADFRVSLSVETDLTKAVASDDISDALNYATLYEVVKREMQIPSRLLEHVAGRIAQAVFDRFPEVTALEISITKVNPPMGADCEGAGVSLKATKSPNEK